MRVTHKILKQEFQVASILIEVNSSGVKGIVSVVGDVPTKYCSICRDRGMPEPSICTIPTFTLDDIEETITLQKGA